MENIKFDEKNYRKHNNKNKKLIKKSLQDCGAGRSIVIDNEDNIIAGNGIYEQAQKLKMPVKVIETDGSELVVVKRTDLATNDDKRKQLAIMDNSTSDSSEFDLSLLNIDFNIEKLQDFGVIDEITTIENIEEEVKEEENININAEYERIIITYKPEDKEKLENLLCITSISQIVYEFKDGELI